MDMNPIHVSAHDIVETVRSSILVLSEDFHVTSANRAFYITFGVTPEETVGRLIYDLGNGYLNVPPLRRLLETVIPEQEVIEAYEIEQHFENIGHRCFVLHTPKPVGISGQRFKSGRLFKLNAAEKCSHRRSTTGINE